MTGALCQMLFSIQPNSRSLNFIDILFLDNDNQLEKSELDETAIK